MKTLIKIVAGILLFTCLAFLSAIDSLSLTALLIGFPIAILSGYLGLKLWDKVAKREFIDGKWI